MFVRSMVSAVLALLLAGGGVALAEPGKGQADLRVSVAYAQDEYLPGADLEATVTVENVGTAVAEGFVFDLKANYVVAPEEYAKVKDLKRLEPGAKHSAVVVGKQVNANEVTGTLFVKVDVDGVVDPTPADNEVTGRTSIVKAQGAVNGTVYVDVDRNGRVDDGEGKAGVEFRSDGGSPFVSLSAVTDANGRFSFRNVPSGDHRLRFVGADGLVVKPGSSRFTVASGKETVLDLAAVRPVSEALTVALGFDKSSYGESGQVGLDVTLTNKGAEALVGVVAVCESGSDLLPGTGSGWAALAPGGHGVDVPAGESKTVRVTDVVPGGAYDIGGVGVQCVFGDNGEFVDGYAKASARADVVGAVGDVKGDVKHGDQAVAGASLVALHPKTRALLGRTTAGADGTFALKGLPAGEVSVIVLGPWQDALTGGVDHVVPIKRGVEGVLALSVVPGPVVPDPDAELELGAVVEFTADSFDSNAPATLKVTLTNTSGAPMTVIARCDGDLRNDTDGWGPLKLDGPGVEVPTGEAKTVDVTAAIPKTAQDRGYVAVRCSFGPKAGTAFVTARATAKVTGALASATGSLLRPDGTTVADTKIVLVDPDTSAPVAHTTTDAAGKFTFTDVQAGRYRPVVVGPWKVVDTDLYELVRGTDTKRDIHVEPGPDVQEPGTTTPPETTQPPTEGAPPSDDDLAHTGAGVIGIALLGVLALGLGLGAVLLGRRRGKAV